MKNTIKEIVRTVVIPFIIGILVSTAAIYAVFNWTDLTNGITNEEDAQSMYIDTKFERVDKLQGIYSWDEMDPIGFIPTDEHTRFVAVFVVDDVTYIAGFNYANDFKVSFFGFGNEFKAYSPEWCRVA